MIFNNYFVSYKKSQIKNLEDDIKIISKSNKKNNKLIELKKYFDIPCHKL